MKTTPRFTVLRRPCRVLSPPSTAWLAPKKRPFERGLYCRNQANAQNADFGALTKQYEATPGAGAALDLDYMWTGQRLDKGTGKYYMLNRHYDASLGKFLQRDPIGLQGGDNLYAFGDGDPINFSDANGLWPIPTMGQVKAAAASSSIPPYLLGAVYAQENQTYVSKWDDARMWVYRNVLKPSTDWLGWDGSLGIMNVSPSTAAFLDGKLRTGPTAYPLLERGERTSRYLVQIEPGDDTNYTRELMKTEVNLSYAARYLAYLADYLFPGRDDLSLNEWALVASWYQAGSSAGYDPNHLTRYGSEVLKDMIRGSQDPRYKP